MKIVKDRGDHSMQVSDFFLLRVIRNGSSSSSLLYLVSSDLLSFGSDNGSEDPSSMQTCDALCNRI